MPVKRTSKKAYLAGKDSMGREIEREKIYDFIAENDWTHPVSRAQIAQKTKIPINRVCPRVRELLDDGRIMVAGEFPCPVTGRSVEGLKVTRWTLLHPEGVE